MDMAAWDLIHLEDELLDFTPFFVKRTKKKKMEIRGKDSIWKLRILFTCSMNAQNLLLFSNIHWSNGKLGWMWYYPLAGRILKIHPVFEKKWKIAVKDRI